MERVEQVWNMVLLSRCWSAELEKQHIKYLLSNSIFQKAKKKYLVETSTCCSARGAEDRGQLQDLCGMSLCRKTGHEHWSPPPENSKQE